MNATDVADEMQMSALLDVPSAIKPTQKNKLYKIILMWNRLEPLFQVRCHSSCLFTADTSLLQQSDVVVLHFNTLEDFPLNRKPSQRFVFYNFESPVNTVTGLLNDPRIRFNYFNWTMTYRQDSDIFLRDYYGSLVTKSLFSQKGKYKFNIIEHQKTKIKNYPINQSKNNNSFTKKERVIKNDNLTSFIKGKKKMVTWFVGHCKTPIRREEYVRQLSQYVPVDIFGKCTKECPSNCDEMVHTDYKFYLAFENSWCPDYITEKFSRPLLYGAVPVVLGGADYRKIAPLNSYINARDFNSPKDLADYLILLNNTDSLYASYFNWKKDFYLSVPDMDGWCELCEMAHDRRSPKKVYQDIKKWWMLDGGECELDSTKYF